MTKVEQGLIRDGVRAPFRVNAATATPHDKVRTYAQP